MKQKLIMPVCVLTALLASPLLTFAYSPEAVDLGLSVKWAACNLGAAAPEEFGTYFAWGDVTGMTWDGSEWSDGGFYENRQCKLDSTGHLVSRYDAAHVKWGGKWRMPTEEEFEELVNNCTANWTDDYNGKGVAGTIFTSKKNGNSIFLPAAGYGVGSGLGSVGSEGHYWSNSRFFSSVAWHLYFSSDYAITSSSGGQYGQSVRPVKK